MWAMRGGNGRGEGETGGQLAEAVKVSARTAGHGGRVTFEFGTPMNSSPLDPGKQNNNNFKEKKTKGKKQKLLNEKFPVQFGSGRIK